MRAETLSETAAARESVSDLPPMVSGHDQPSSGAPPRVPLRVRVSDAAECRGIADGAWPM